MSLIPTVIHRVPVFALENYVLLPYTVAALQVFEPGGRHLVDDCEATDRLLVIAGLEPGWRDADGPPAVHPVAGLGKLVNARTLEDRSREVFVHGIARVRLLELHQERPYRIAAVERVDDLVARHERRRLRGVLRRLHDYLNGLVRAGRVGADVSRVIAGSEDPGVLSYRLGAVLLPDPAARQRLLEQRSPVARLEVLVEAVAALLMDEATPALSEADVDLTNVSVEGLIN